MERHSSSWSPHRLLLLLLCLSEHPLIFAWTLDFRLKLWDCIRSGSFGSVLRSGSSSNGLVMYLIACPKLAATAFFGLVARSEILELLEDFVDASVHLRLIVCGVQRTLCCDYWSALCAAHFYRDLLAGDGSRCAKYALSYTAGGQSLPAILLLDLLALLDLVV